MLTLAAGLILDLAQDAARPDAEPRNREHAALAAYERFGQENRPPADATVEQIAELARGMRARLLAFAAEWPGTAASYRARLDGASLDLHLLERPDDGLALLAEVYAEIKARAQPLPPRARLTLGKVAIQYAEELVRRERFDPAEVILQELTAKEAPEQARARTMLEELPQRRRLAVGQPLPPFLARDLTGREVSPATFRGQVLLLDFWATWCGPCRAEMPSLVRLHEEFGAQGLAILGVSLDKANARAAVETFAREQGMTWAQVYDGSYWEAALARQFLVRSIPATMLVDRRGVIRYRDLRGAALHEAVAALLAEP